MAAPRGAGDPDAQMARAREGLYGLASRVFSDKPSGALLEGMKSPEMLEALASFGITFDEGFIAGDGGEQSERLAEEYARLFTATGPHIAPYESVYVRAWSEDVPQLWGEATVAVAKFYRDAGLELQPGRTPDHIGLELEAMSVLAGCEAARREAGDGEGAAELERLQKDFCREHLMAWVPEVCKAVEEMTAESFYRSMAVLTASLVRMHCGNEESEADEKNANA